MKYRKKECGKIRNLQIHRKPPELLTALPRLLARLPPNSQAYDEISNRLYRVQAGYAGEQLVDRYLEKIMVHHTPTHIVTDVSFFLAPNEFFQIDTLIITPDKIRLLEIKNMSGTLTYHANPPHFECTYDDRKTIAIGCPLMQMENNRTALVSWLQQNGFPIQVEGLIVLANNSALIRNVPATMPIIYAKHLPHYFRTMKPETPVLSNQQMTALLQKLKGSQKPYNPYPLIERFHLDPNLIKTGLLCPYCHAVLTRKNRKTWTCHTCARQTHYPYKETLQDWFMIMKPTISNKECRDFLRIKDKFAANHILKTLPLTREGQSHATIYRWDYTISPSTLATTQDSP